MAEQQDYAAILRIGFDRILNNKYGACIPPAPYFTAFGVRPLDFLLGGGITSSAPVAFSSTPETGKSTTALQFCSIFLMTHENSVCVYLDSESAAGGESRDIEDRIDTFGICRERFLYKPIVMDLKQTFEMLQELITLKKSVEEKTGKELFVLFVLDSIASTTSSKDSSAEDPNEVIGFKARELTFNLNKYKQYLSMQRVTFIVIDQVRANMQIKSQWQAATDEKSVGTFGNFKSATNVSALQHNIRQWLWLSKGEALKPSDPMGIDGWILNVFTEKNKLAPSHYSVPLVFDKKYGVSPVWSEYWFMSNKTKTERKYWPKEKALIYPFCIQTTGNSRYLEVVNPDTGEIMYTSPKFMESKFLQIHAEDATFKSWFDYAVYISCQQRIDRALFRTDPAKQEIVVNSSDVETPIAACSELGELGEIQAATPTVAMNETQIPPEAMDETPEIDDYTG